MSVRVGLTSGTKLRARGVSKFKTRQCCSLVRGVQRLWLAHFLAANRGHV